MKTLLFTPPVDDTTYPQYAVLVEDGVAISQYRGATVPNDPPREPDGKKGVPAYPVVAKGVYDAYYSAWGHHGLPGIVLEDNKPVPIMQDINPKTGKTTADYIHVHGGYKPGWRGSAGCMTLAMGGTNWMVKHFIEKEGLQVSIPNQGWYIDVKPQT